MKPGSALDFIAESFKTDTCTGETKLLKDFDTWELLNMKVHTILEIPARLREDYSISAQFLDSVLKKFLIQSNSKDALEKRWGLDQPVQFCVAQSKHYSWPKAAGKSLPAALVALNLS